MYDLNDVCVQCDTPAEVDVMDFGPYVGKLICADCWDTTEPATVME